MTTYMDIMCAIIWGLAFCVCDLLCGGHITMEAWKKALFMTNSFIKWNANECENDFVQAFFVIYFGEKPMRCQNGGNRIGHKVNLHREQEYKDNIQKNYLKHSCMMTSCYVDKTKCNLLSSFVIYE